jgi:hypothetical protein
MDERLDVGGIVGALAVHTDARRWEDLGKLFAPEVQVDYTSLFGGEPKVTPRDQLIEQWRELLPGFTHTTHLIGTPLTVVRGEQAQCTASVVASHVVKDGGLAGVDCWIVGGCYEMIFQKMNGSWRISSLTLARAWTEGNLDLPRIARERVAAATLDKK